MEFGQALPGVFIFFPLVLEGIFKILIAQDGVFWNIGEPSPCLSSKDLGKQFGFNVFMVYFFQVSPICEQL